LLAYLELMKEDAQQAYRFDVLMWAVIREPNKRAPQLPRILKDA
jgi:hypothetical protein